jgi:hypothetical protein
MCDATRCHPVPQFRAVVFRASRIADGYCRRARCVATSSGHRGQIHSAGARLAAPRAPCSSSNGPSTAWSGPQGSSLAQPSSRARDRRTRKRVAVLRRPSPVVNGIGCSHFALMIPQTAVAGWRETAGGSRPPRMSIRSRVEFRSDRHARGGSSIRTSDGTRPVRSLCGKRAGLPLSRVRCPDHVRDRPGSGGSPDTPSSRQRHTGGADRVGGDRVSTCLPCVNNIPTVCTASGRCNGNDEN